MSEHLTGRCLCGAVKFTVAGSVTDPIACHCRDCQRHSGSPYWTAVSAASDDVTIARNRLGWVRVTQRAWRGFCRDCGGYLFWQPVSGRTLDIALGALDQCLSKPLRARIFTAEARLPLPDDGVPRYEGGLPAKAPEKS